MIFQCKFAEDYRLSEITTGGHSFSGSLRQLTLLNLNENRLSAIPPSISQLRGLRQLSLSNNAITHLPGEIGALQVLVELHLNGNNLHK